MGPEAKGVRAPHLNSHVRFARLAAERRGYGFRSLDGEDAYLFEVRDGARVAVFACGSASPYGVNSARAHTLARDKDFCARALAEAGLPTIPGRLFFTNDRHRAYRAPGREPEDAAAFAASAAYPLFCKPNAGAKGQMAEIIADEAAFANYFSRAATFYDAILAQPYLDGDEYRVVTLDGCVLCSYKKTKPYLIGDGVNSAAALYARGRRSASVVHRFSDALGRVIAGDVVPALGARIFLDGPANRAAGGDAEPLTKNPPEPLAHLAVKAAAVIGLRLAALDIFDISPNRDLSALTIIEVNAAPALETLEAQGYFDLIEKIWFANFDEALR